MILIPNLNSTVTSYADLLVLSVEVPLSRLICFCLNLSLIS